VTSSGQKAGSAVATASTGESAATAAAAAAADGDDDDDDDDTAKEASGGNDSGTASSIIISYVTETILAAFISAVHASKIKVRISETVVSAAAQIHGCCISFKTFDETSGKVSTVHRTKHAGYPGCTRQVAIPVYF